MSSFENDLVELAKGIDKVNEFGFDPSCDVCQHPGAAESVKHYLSSGNDSKKVSKWFDKKYGKSFTADELKKHFDDHVMPCIRENASGLVKRIELLTKRSKNKESNHLDRLAFTREMLLESMLQTFVAMPNPAQLRDFRTMVSAQSELAKGIRETISMEYEIMGGGRTPEEMKEIMQNMSKMWLEDKLKQLDEFPEAKAKLEELLGISQTAEIVEDEPGA